MLGIMWGIEGQYTRGPMPVGTGRERQLIGFTCDLYTVQRSMPVSDPWQGGPVSLKVLAKHLNLSPATVSFVLNDTPNRSIPETTRERVRAAAKLFNYQPSMAARMLKRKSTKTIGILLPELGEGYHAQVLSGAADVLMREGYFFFTAHHRHHPDLVTQYPQLLLARGAEGLIAIDTHLRAKPGCPTVEVASRTELPQCTNIVLDHKRAAELSLQYLHQSGHRVIAFMHGPPFSSDTSRRWQATTQVARSLGIKIARELTIHLQDVNTPALGYPGIQDLLTRRRDFTAVLCFNDIAAIGCIRALHDAGLRVPEDVSVIGFDDIQSGAYYVPSLTTVRQPLIQMGATAAELLLKSMRGEQVDDVVLIEPELVLRESTCATRLPAATLPAVGAKRRV